MTTSLYAEAAPTASPTGKPRRALAIGAHPDDVEFGAGGTLAAWAQEGCEVSMLVVTDGSKGSWDPGMQPEELIAARRREQHAAAAVLGASSVVMLEHVDGELEATMALRRELALWIRKIRPDVVLTHDPWQRYQLHPDHRVTGISVVDAVVAARDHLFFPDQLTGGVEKHRPEWIFLWSAEEPDHFVDISATFEVKVRALLQHSSQGVTTMSGAHQGHAELEAFRTRLLDWAARQGSAAGIPTAEAFKLLRP